MSSESRTPHTSTTMQKGGQTADIVSSGIISTGEQRGQQNDNGYGVWLEID